MKKLILAALLIAPAVQASEFTDVCNEKGAQVRFNDINYFCNWNPKTLTGRNYRSITLRSSDKIAISEYSMNYDINAKRQNDLNNIIRRNIALFDTLIVEYSNYGKSIKPRHEKTRSNNISESRLIHNTDGNTLVVSKSTTYANYNYTGYYIACETGCTYLKNEFKYFDK